MKYLMMILAMVSVGCSDAGFEVSGSEMGNTKVQYQKKSLSSKVIVTDIRSTRVGDLLKISAVLQSKKSKNMALQYKVAFVDGAGFEIDVDSRPWTPMTLGAGSRQSIQAVSPRASAVDYRIYIKQLKK